MAGSHVQLSIVDAVPLLAFSLGGSGHEVMIPSDIFKLIVSNRSATTSADQNFCASSASAVGDKVNISRKDHNTFATSQ